MKKILALLCCSVLALGCGCSDSEENNLKLYDNPLISFEYPDNITIKERNQNTIMLENGVDKSNIILYISEKSEPFPQDLDKQVANLEEYGFICDIKDFGDNTWLCWESESKNKYYYYHQKGFYEIRLESTYGPNNKITKNMLSSASFDFDLHKKENSINSDFGVLTERLDFLDEQTYTACIEIVNLCDDIIDGHIKAEYCTDEFEKYYTIIQSARSESEETKLDTIKIICDTMKIEIDRKNYDTKQGRPNYEFEYDLNENRNELANYIGVAEREIN